jgi:hypothetical protein
LGRCVTIINVQSLFPSPPIQSLPEVIRALRAAVATWGGRRLLSTALVLLVYRRLGEISRRMEGLASRFQAGRLWRLGPRPASGAGVAGDPVRRVRGERIWPRTFAWLVRAAGWEAAGFGSQLRVILQQPEMVALLQAAPQARRVLTPLCRMLAVETGLLRPGVVADAGDAAGSAVPVVRMRAARPVVDLGRVPIPRGVMAAVRRGRFLRGG